MSNPVVRLRILGQGMDKIIDFPEGDWLTFTDADNKTIMQVEVVEIIHPVKKIEIGAYMRDGGAWKWVTRRIVREED